MDFSIGNGWLVVLFVAFLAYWIGSLMWAIVHVDLGKRWWNVWSWFID